MSVLIYEKKDHIAYITMNRPEVLNAINQELSSALYSAWLDVKEDPDVWVVILSGNGRAFSTGHDVKALHAEGKNPVRFGIQVKPLALGVWKPIIAAIDGYAVAGGLSMALQCDIRVATERSIFAYTEYRIGRLGSAPPPLHYAMPLGEALYTIFTGSQISAQDAYRWGLIHKVLPDREALIKEAEHIASEIKMCAPLVVQAAKRVFYESFGMPQEYADRLAQPFDQALLQTEDAHEGPRAFVEKRKPIWQAK